MGDYPWWRAQWSRGYQKRSDQSGRERVVDKNPFKLYLRQSPGVRRRFGLVGYEPLAIRAGLFDFEKILQQEMALTHSAEPG